MVHLISYDLNKPGQDYLSLYTAIKNLGAWWHYLDSTWLVASDLSTSQVSTLLQAQIDKNDRLLVIRVTGDYAGWLPKDAWEWLNSQTF